jgi:hypothetical protein
VVISRNYQSVPDQSTFSPLIRNPPRGSCGLFDFNRANCNPYANITVRPFNTLTDRDFGIYPHLAGGRYLEGRGWFSFIRQAEGCFGQTGCDFGFTLFSAGNLPIRVRVRAIYNPDMDVLLANRAITDTLMAAIESTSFYEAQLVGSCPRIGEMRCRYSGTLFFPDRITVTNFLVENNRTRGVHSTWELELTGSQPVQGPRCSRVLTSSNQQAITLAALAVIGPWVAVAGAVVAAAVNVACG